VAGAAGVATADDAALRRAHASVGHARLIDADPCRKPWVVPKGGPDRPTGRWRTVRAGAGGALGSGGALVFVDEAAQDIHAFDRLMLPTFCEAASFDWCAQAQAPVGSGRAVVR
jgi:hypothetical protein